jgi:UDP:flavonoid glycosyltransferase YjiC (YdhE family)
MHAILVTLGTDGDVFPFIAVGDRLRNRGHRVTLAANENFRDHAHQRGLEFAPLVSHDETRRLLENPDVWHPVRSALAGARWARAALARQHALIASLVGQPDTVLIGYPPIVAGRLAQVQFGRPLVSLMPMPWLILSDARPPALGNLFKYPFLGWPGVRRALWRLAEFANNRLIGREVNRIARRLGLPPIRQLYRWCLSPQRIIGLFPDWYAPPQPDWPTQTRLAGFALYDGSRGQPLPSELLDFCRAGSPPIAITFGTGMLHGSRLFQHAVQACTELGQRAVLLSKDRGQLSDELPPTMRHCAYAPFGQLLPRCAAVIHHGGIGTTAQSLAAGVPQVILPMAWDQPDNADRVRRLGVGRALSPDRDAASLARALESVMTPDTVARCRAIARRFDPQDPLELAATWVEEASARPA